MDTSTYVIMLAVLSTGLSAGLFAAFSYAVMPGLRRADDDAFVAAMRGINIAIINPLFAVIFGGALVAVIAALIVSWSDDASRWWALGGLVTYLAVLGVTMGVNVPLNDALAAGPGGTPSRRSFEPRWVRSNHVRSVFAVASFGCLVVALAHS